MARTAQIALALTFVLCLTFAAKTDFKFVEYMTVDRFEHFKDSPDIRVAYFYIRDVPRLASFYREYDRSAELLANYHVKCAVVDCSKGRTAEHCQKKKGEHFVYAFRDGYELLQLELETMFDVNSIMSNVLQLVLLKDVPIVQTEEELIELEDSVKEQHDLILAYHRAIGTYEHRLFMDVAYAYQSKFKFAVTTEKTTTSFLPGAKDDPNALCMMWALSCRTTQRASGNRHCKAVKFIGKLDMMDVATFVRALELPSVYHIPGDGLTIPYGDLIMHVLYLYHGNSRLQLTYDLAQNLSSTYWGNVGIITVNVEAKNLPEELKFNGELPMAKLKLKNVDDDRVIVGQDDPTRLRNFVMDALSDFKRGVRDQKTAESDQRNYGEMITEIENEVEQMDDPVAKAVYELKKKVLPLDNVPALTDKSFVETLGRKNFLVVLFYLHIDSVSAAFLHAYAEAGASFTSPSDSPLARVDCSDWTDVCLQQNITMYPTILSYSNGEKQKTYNGHLGKESILTAAKLYQLDGFVKPASKEEVKLFSEGLFPEDLRHASSVSVLALTDRETDIYEFRTVASDYEHSLAFGLITDKSLGKQIAADHGVTPPCVLLFKRNDPLKPVEVFNKEMTSKKIGMFVSYASLPVFGELTPANLPQINRQFRPLVVVFVGVSDESVLANIRKVVAAEEQTWAMFSFMNVSGVDSLGSKLLYHYTKQPRLPHISVVVRYKAEVYNYPGVDFSVKAISKWLTEINDDMVSPTMNLPRGTWRPKHEGFDFLRMIDEGVADTLGSDDDTDLANEEGIGFDADGNYNMPHDMNEEDQLLGQSVDEFYQGDQSDDSPDEAGSLEKSRLSGHHKRPAHGSKAQSPVTAPQQGTPAPATDPTTLQPQEVNTHDGGEL